MATAIEKADAKRFVEDARGYIELLRQHIQKEDHCLFTMANQAFSETDQRKLLEGFETVERDHMGTGTHEKFLKLADDLAEKFGVAKASLAGGHSCCCQH